MIADPKPATVPKISISGHLLVGSFPYSFGQVLTTRLLKRA
jgi:hypothetical protein